MSHISSVSKSCFSFIRDLRRIRNTLDFTTAHTITTSLLHSKLDYCDSLFLNLPQSQLNRLQLILNSTARACPKLKIFRTSHQFSNLTIGLKLNSEVNTRLSLLPTKLFKPTYLNDLLHIQRNRNTRSSDTVTLWRPSVCSHMKLSDIIHASCSCTLE